MNRELGAAVGLCLAGSALSLLAASRGWVHYDVDPGAALPLQRTTLTGEQLASGLRPLALVGLAGVVAVLATRTWGRLLVGALLTACGAGIAVLAVAHRTSHVHADVHEATAWPWAAALGGLLVLAAGALTAARGRRWAGMSAAYRTPAARAEAAPVTDKGVWDALDRGEDPTVPASDGADTVTP
ncbi:MAG: family rane protein [Frankiales bacterium]|nr:family rane protein [Frankiales bacterium]